MCAMHGASTRRHDEGRAPEVDLRHVEHARLEPVAPRGRAGAAAARRPTRRTFASATATARRTADRRPASSSALSVAWSPSSRHSVRKRGVNEVAAVRGVDPDRRLVERARAEAQLGLRPERARRLQLEQPRTAALALPGRDRRQRRIASTTRASGRCACWLSCQARLGPGRGGDELGDAREQRARQQGRIVVDLRDAQDHLRRRCASRRSNASARSPARRARPMRAARRGAPGQPRGRNGSGAAGGGQARRVQAADPQRVEAHAGTGLGIDHQQRRTQLLRLEQHAAGHFPQQAGSLGTRHAAREFVAGAELAQPANASAAPPGAPCRRAGPGQPNAVRRSKISLNNYLEVAFSGQFDITARARQPAA